MPSGKYQISDDDSLGLFPSSLVLDDADVYAVLQQEAACFIGQEGYLADCERWMLELNASQDGSSMVSKLPALSAALRVLRATTRSLAESRERVIADLVANPGLLQGGTARQLLLGAERRYRILSSIEHLDCQGVAIRMGFSASLAGEVIADRTGKNELFSVSVGATEMFPGYQFDPVTGSIRTEVKQIIESFPKGTTGWAISFWFYAPNVYLNGARPHELLVADPKAVVRAAQVANELLDY
ncbi:hypothetical protein HPT27_11510 [Permianibacter sp. IMCC34836]|uniref:hypothetical protein n=1 Tax=Permianibacter fluminis TaxID=2738515 RepID=UPI0015524A08|nr:hypothetical protein [Permianibacter fluminis]NQD37653.1 hypothetical protein [Permianibacter fluminis]